MDTQLINYGIGGVALLLIIKELFAYLKTRKSGGGVNQQILDTVKTMNGNHLHAMEDSMKVISKDLNAGNDRVVAAITAMHIDLAGRLGKLEGKLDNK